MRCIEVYAKIKNKTATTTEQEDFDYYNETSKKLERDCVKNIVNTPLEFNDD